ncbi:hypothetical protein [Nonomuraea phyllanthi]|nr:hypothetical protein [Nonomuraea phyllanthi]
MTVVRALASPCEPASGDHRERLLARRAQLEGQREYDRAQLEVA